jgi:hypothetical protein
MPFALSLFSRRCFAKRATSSISPSSISPSPSTVKKRAKPSARASSATPALPSVPSVVQQPPVVVKSKKAVVAASVSDAVQVRAPFLFSVDLGVKKIAYCLFDTTQMRIVEWKRVDLEDAGVNSANVEEVVEYFEAFIKANQRLFQMDCHVLIENQVSSRLRVVQAVAYTAMRTVASTQIVNPRRVKQYFGISTGVYAHNKKASVFECQRRLLLDTAPDESAHWIKELESNRKQDDLADCFLQALFWRHLLWKK